MLVIIIPCHISQYLTSCEIFYSLLIEYAIGCFRVGKRKILKIGRLTRRHTLVIRFQGGSNAGKAFKNNSYFRDFDGQLKPLKW